MPLGTFKASILGASASTDDTYWAGLFYTDRSGNYITADAFGALDSEGNIAIGARDNSNNPTFTTISGGSTPSVLADSGGYYSSYSNLGQNGYMVVRDDGKVAVGWVTSGTYYYTLHTSTSDWGIVSGFTPYTTTGSYTSSTLTELKGLASKGNEDFCGWYGRNASYLYRPNAGKLRSTGTSGNLTYKWEGSRTGNDETVCSISVSGGDEVWLAGLENTGSSINKIQFLGWDKDTANPSSGGTTQETLDASGYGFRSVAYNAASGYDSAGYLVAGISWPNTASGPTIARSTSADAPETLDWVRKLQIGTPAYTYSDGMRFISQPVLDSEGNIYVAWWNQLKSPSKYCYIIASWENDGTFRWARTLAMYGTSGYAYTYPSSPCTLAVTPNDSLVFIGTGGVTTSSTDHPATLVARLPSDGSLTSASAIQPRGDATAEIYWMNDLTGNWAPIEAAGNLVAGTDTGEEMNGSTGTTSNLTTTTAANTRTFSQAEVTG
jgi:hypothetical protein